MERPSRSGRPLPFRGPVQFRSGRVSSAPISAGHPSSVFRAVAAPVRVRGGGRLGIERQEYSCIVSLLGQSGQTDPEFKKY